ncbi:ArdC-like ssDNA-binding domain-containing protein [Dermabacteraceae bacterium P13101]
MARKRINPQARQGEIEALQKTIAERVEALHSEVDWEKFLAFAATFYRYSFNNMLLIQAQKPYATYVAGYQSWRSRGRQVRKGEKGIRIFGSRLIDITADEDKEEGTPIKFRKFFPVSVFDISQTDIVDPDKAEEVPTLAQHLQGEAPEGLADTIKQMLHSKGWTVTEQEIPGAANGYTTTKGDKKIVIDESLSPKQALKTLIHETGHALLHTDENGRAATTADRRTKETEAESIAYVVAGYLGIDTSDYSIGYIAGWSKFSTELIKQTARNVIETSKQIIEAIESQPPQVQREAA